MHGASLGNVEVYYLEEKLQKDQKPFLQQEKNLIHAIAERLGRIIERKRTEEEKVKLETRLQQAQKMEAIATLAGGIAHQFNNAIYGITGNIDLLEMAVPDAAQLKDYVDPTKDSAQRMANLTNQLLAYARGGRYQPELISLNSAIKDLLPMLHHRNNPAIQINAELDDNVFDVKADFTQFQMVLSAVITNAFEAIKGAGHIRISTRNHTVRTEVARNFSAHGMEHNHPR